MAQCGWRGGLDARRTQCSVANWTPDQASSGVCGLPSAGPDFTVRRRTKEPKVWICSQLVTYATAWRRRRPPFTSRARGCDLGPVSARAAAVIRSIAAAYIIVQVGLWHSFYAAHTWRLAGPAVAIGWAVALVVWLAARQRPAAWLVAADSAVLVTLALSGAWWVPPEMRGDTASWLYILLAAQSVFPLWCAPIGARGAAGARVLRRLLGGRRASFSGPGGQQRTWRLDGADPRGCRRGLDRLPDAGWPCRRG